MEAGAALRKLVGGLLLAAGAIIALTCGLCTTYFSVTILIDHFRTQAPDDFSILGALLAYGGAVTAVGVAIAWGGLAMLRARPRPGGGDPPEPEG